MVIVPTPLQMAKLLEEKKIDFYLESPYPTYLNVLFPLAKGEFSKDT